MTHTQGEAFLRESWVPSPYSWHAFENRFLTAFAKCITRVFLELVLEVGVVVIIIKGTSASVGKNLFYSARHVSAR